MKKCSKRGLFKFFGPILGFYIKKSPWNSWSSHFMITLWNQKSQNAGTPCTTVIHSLHTWHKISTDFMNSPLLTWWIELSKVAMQIAPYSTNVICPKYYKNSMNLWNSAKVSYIWRCSFCVFSIKKINTKVKNYLHCSICTIKLQKKTINFGLKLYFLGPK